MFIRREVLWSGKQWSKVHLLARKGFLFCIQLFICVSWFADEAASPPSLPPSLPPVHTRSLQCGVRSWECPGCCSMLGCPWTNRMLKLRYPILGSLIPFRVLTLHILPLRLHFSTRNLPSPPHSTILCREFPGGCSQTPMAPFPGRQQRGTAHGFAQGALAEPGRGPGALSGYNLGAINRGSKGSRFLFSL